MAGNDQEPLDPIEIARHGPVIPVVVIEHLEAAVPMARTLVEAGIRVVEITLRTNVALAAIEAIARAVPEAIVGAGTVRSAADAAAAQSADALASGDWPRIGRLAREAAAWRR